MSCARPRVRLTFSERSFPVCRSRLGLRPPLCSRTTRCPGAIPSQPRARAVGGAPPKLLAAVCALPARQARPIARLAAPVVTPPAWGRHRRPQEGEAQRQVGWRDLHCPRTGASLEVRRPGCDPQDAVGVPVVQGAHRAERPPGPRNFHRGRQRAEHPLSAAAPLLMTASLLHGGGHNSAAGGACVTRPPRACKRHGSATGGARMSKSSKSS